MTFESELQKRTIRTRDEGPADGAQRNARIAAMAAASLAEPHDDQDGGVDLPRAPGARISRLWDILSRSAMSPRLSDPSLGWRGLGGGG